MNYSKLSVFICLVLSLMALSYQLNAAENLTLERAMDITLQNNFGIKIIEQDYFQFEKNTTSGNAGMLPSVDIGGSYQKYFGDFNTHAYTGQSIHERDVSSNISDVWINLNWTLFDGLRMFTEYDRLEKLKETGEQTIKIQIEQTMAQLIIAYSAIAKEKAILDALEERFDLSKYRADIVRKSYDIGKSPDIELLQALVEMKSDSTAIITQNAHFQNSLMTLYEIMGIYPSNSFDFNDSLKLADIPDIKVLTEQSISNNNKLLLERKLIEVRKLEVSKVSSEYLPRVELDAGYYFSETDAEAAFIHYNRFVGPKLALTLKYNLFDGFNTNRKIENSEIDLEKQRLSEKELELKLKSALTQYWNQYISYKDIAEYEKENIVLSEKNLSISKKSYEAGTISALDFREAQQRHTETKIRIIESLHYAKLYETKLLLLSGALLSANR